MTRAAAARKIRKTQVPKRTIAIALSGSGPGNGPRPSRGWRHAMSTRTRTSIRRLLAAAALALPLAGRPARALEGLRPVRELDATHPNAPRLSRLLTRLRRNRSTIDAEVKARRLTEAEGRRLRRDLAAVERKARALARKTRHLSEESAKALDGEIDEIGRRIRS